MSGLMQTGNLLGTEAAAKFVEYTQERVRGWDEYAQTWERWQGVRGYYQRRLREIYTCLIPPGMRVLEVGCAGGDLLAALRPRYGVGLDFSGPMIERARKAHPHLKWVHADAHDFDLGEKFDYIVCSDLINDLFDVQEVFGNIARHCHSGTKLILNAYSRMWEVPRKLAEAVGLANNQFPQNWLAPGDICNLLYLEDFEPIRISEEILWPFWTPLIDTIANKYLVKMSPFKWFGLANVYVARPKPKAPRAEGIVSVVVAARNEEGNVPAIFDRVPQMGAGTELIFVEGNSKDDTWGAIEREIARRPDVNAKLFKQPGKGKGDA